MLGIGETQPAWFGKPVASLRAMAEQIAADPRFDRCAVETLATVLWRRPPDIDDHDRIDGLRVGFQADGTKLRALLAAVTDTPEYRAGGLVADASATAEAREQTTRMLSPNQLGTAVRDLTGFYWVVNNYEELENDREGHRVLGGGVNGENVSSPQTDPGLTWALVVKRLAEGGAGWAVRAELERGEAGVGLFDGLATDGGPGDPAFETWLAELHWRLYATRPDEARLQAARDLWTAIATQEGENAAWQGLVAALLRDPAFVTE